MREIAPLLVSQIFKEEIMDFTTLTIDILKTLSIFGGYGIGIILLTIIIRAAMWPLGVSQQRSMRTMQMLQPKMKAIQERYKSAADGAFISLYHILYRLTIILSCTFLFSFSMISWLKEASSIL